ncbi:MAG: fatty acid desaturase family protein, partial [Cyanobacteria bacterium J06649_11]
NDWVSNIFTMYPIFTSIEKYRANHLKHHQHLNSDDDPDWVAKLTKRAFQFPKTKQEFLLTIGSYLTFYQGILDAIWFAKRYKNVDQQVGQSSYTTDQIIFYGIMFIVFTVFQLWQLYLLFWLVPYLTTFFMFQYIRSVAEHYGELAYEHDLSSTRTVVTNRFEQFLFAPHAVNYHLEHHLYPGVPFYNLPKLHRLLMELPAFRQEAHITNGYFSGLLNELGALQVEAS